MLPLVLEFSIERRAHYSRFSLDEFWMQLEALKIFCDVARWASFSRGARENGVSQSSASQAVHQLELRLGVKLIDRSQRPLVLTAHGQVFYEGCRDILERYIEVENRVKALENDHKVAGTVRVAAIYSVGLHDMSRYTERFRELYPQAAVRLEYMHPTEIVDRVLNDEIELGLLSFPRKWPELKVIPWRDEEMVLAVPPAHPFAGRAEVDVSELDGEKFVNFDSELSIRRAIDRFLRRHHVQVETAAEFDNIENIKRAVEDQLGLSILPRPTLAQEVKAGTLFAVPFTRPEFMRPLAIIHRRSGQLGLAASRFLKLLTADGAAGGLRIAAAAPASEGRGRFPETSTN
jgi:DNA-binding transcriptional LysR family regulator